MYIISELTGVVAEMLLAHIYFKGFFAQKNVPWWAKWCAYGVSGTILALLSFVPNASFIRLAFYAFSLTIIAYVLFLAKLTQAIYAGISFCSIYVLTELLIFGIFSFFDIDTQLIMSYGHARAVCIAVSHMILWLCVLIVLAITRRRRIAVTLPFLFALAPGYIAGIVLGVSFCKQVLAGDDSMSVPVLVSAVGLLYLNILIILYAERAKNASDQQLQIELAEHHYAMQEQYYEQLRSEQEETRLMFHDINKYMRAMRALVAEGNANEASQMLEETQKLFDSLGKVADVGNSVISVIINEYKEMADESDIPFKYDVSVPQNLGISAVELYVLLGNTLDNAIEACEHLPAGQRYINLQLRVYHNMLFYQIENPYGQDYFSRTRSDRHGYGLQNVRRCVEKHNGDMSINHENNKYIVSLRINDCVPINCSLVH